MSLVAFHGVRDEGYLHDAVLVREEGFVAVAEVQAPDADVFVRAAGRDEFAVAGDGEVEDGEFVAVEGEEEFEGIDEEDLDGVVEGAEGEEPAIRAEGHGEDVVCDFQLARLG